MAELEYLCLQEKIKKRKNLSDVKFSFSYTIDANKIKKYIKLGKLLNRIKLTRLAIILVRFGLRLNTKVIETKHE
ncbi:TPA_asm: hypothetical protein GEV19_02925 [Listeria monocytogenes]|nr:hypothetical protein [Listeria monocytogenes]